MLYSCLWYSKDNSEEDIKPHIRLSKKGRRKEPDWYGEKIGEFGKQGKVNLLRCISCSVLCL